MNRAQRRREARKGVLYHGTAGYLADRIRGHGLHPGRDGLVYLTDSVAMAQRYAMWSTALAATVDDGGFVPTTDIGRKVAELSPYVAAVAHVKLPPGVRPQPERGSSAPPLPWETGMTDGNALYVSRSIPARYVRPFELWRVEELQAPGALAQITVEADRIAAAFRRDETTPGTVPGAEGDFTTAIPSPRHLVAAVEETSASADSDWHGRLHWLGVAAAGVRILEEGCPADPAVVFAFAVLHDSQRHAEGRDPGHGARAADCARRLNGGALLNLSASQLDALSTALVEHDCGEITDDQTIGACWDSDRLTLTRLGVTVDPSLLSTSAARALAADPGRVPDPADCDWSWAAFRYMLVSASPEPYAARWRGVGVNSRLVDPRTLTANADHE